MKNKLEKYRKYLFLGITLIALGVTFNTVFRIVEGSSGTVLIAVGGLFFIIGVSLKKKVVNTNTNEQQTI